jgi:hypothetical protein
MEEEKGTGMEEGKVEVMEGGKGTWMEMKEENSKKLDEEKGTGMEEVKLKGM